MKGKFKLFKKNRTILKNNELNFKISLNILKTNKVSYSFYLKSKVHSMLHNINNRNMLLRSLKGYSIISGKRKAFYSAFQLTRFDIKKLVSYKALVGLRSFTW